MRNRRLTPAQMLLYIGTLLLLLALLTGCRSQRAASSASSADSLAVVTHADSTASATCRAIDRNILHGRNLRIVIDEDVDTLRTRRHIVIEEADTTRVTLRDSASATAAIASASSSLQHITDSMTSDTRQDRRPAATVTGSAMSVVLLLAALAAVWYCWHKFTS